MRLNLVRAQLLPLITAKRPSILLMQYDGIASTHLIRKEHHRPPERFGSGLLQNDPRRLLIVMGTRAVPRAPRG